MESSYTPYKIVFFDGHEEFDKGHVGLHPLLTFKRFQGLISQKIGLSESQSRLCKILLICGNSRNNKPRKLPINENTNFRILLKSTSEKDCYFSVSMKKSRRERRDVQPRAAKPLETLLRRDGVQGFRLIQRGCDTAGFKKSGFQDKWFMGREYILPQSYDYGMQMQRQSHMDVFGSEEAVWSYGVSNNVCEVCFMAKEGAAPFHLCIHDAIVRGTRGPSPAGPIARPLKRALESAV
eukprot:Gb_06537 [translate_table: standard]